MIIMGKSTAAAAAAGLLMLISILIDPSSAQTCNSYRFSSNQLFQSCSDLPVLNSFLHWTYHSANLTADIAFRRPGTSTTTWVVWSLNPSGQRMMGSQALVAYHNSAGVPTAHTAVVDSMSPTLQNATLSFGVSNLRAEYSTSNSEMIIFATLQLDNSLVSTNQVWQEGPMSGTSFGVHPMGANQRSVGTIDFATGSTAAGSGPSNKKKNVHGVLNAISWGIMMPAGVMMARYLKVFKVANPAWFYLHAACQTTAYGIGVSGWATGLKLGSDSSGITHDKHRNIGITLFCFATLQIFALLLRPKPDHKYRIYWNCYHHAIGYATITLSIVNIYEGFDILMPADKWKKIYTGLIIFLGVVAAILEVITWTIVLRRKKTESSNKHSNGGVHTNGYAA